MLRIVALAILIPTLLTATSARAAEPWQRIPLLDEPRLAVTLLIKTSANPADEDFIGFELDNRTDQPLHLAHAHYRLDQVTVSTLGPNGKPLRTQSLASGNGYRWCRLGENVGYGYSIEQVHNAFMASTAHRADRRTTRAV